MRRLEPKIYDDPNKSEKPKKCKTCKMLGIRKNKICKVKAVCRICTNNTCQKHIVIVCQNCTPQVHSSELVMLKNIAPRKARCKVCLSEMPIGVRKILKRQLGMLV